MATFQEAHAMSLSRRELLQLTAPLALGATVTRTASADEGDLPAPIAALKPRLEGVVAISLDERRGRIARAQKLMTETGLDAIVVASGSSLDYFSGAAWGLSERAVVPGCASLSV